MQHDPLVCVEDAIRACELILRFVKGIDNNSYQKDLKTKAAVEREFKIIGEALNRIKTIEPNPDKPEVCSWQFSVGNKSGISSLD